MNSFTFKRLIHGFGVHRLNLSVCLVISGLISIVSIQSAFAIEANSVATIVSTKYSSVVTSAQGLSRTATARMSIYVGDVIETSDEAWVSVNFFDLTRVVLSPNTKLAIRRFPETMSADEIEFEIFKGGIRVTTGTLAAQFPDNFSVLTPQGRVSGGRSEWVLRVCNENDCEPLEQSFTQCQDFQSNDTSDKQYLAVYKGSVSSDYCPNTPAAKTGETSVFSTISHSCEIIDEVPCFILFDHKLGRDKIRKFLPKLTPAAHKEKAPRPKRPNSRSSQSTRPRVIRPSRPRRGR
jgi:hypothetical protein